VDPQYISLATLVQNAQVYERMPVPLQKGLQNSVWLTLILGIAILPILYFVPPLLHPVSDQGFFFFTAGIINWLFRLAQGISGFLFWAVFVSLYLVIIVLIVTAGLKQPAMRIVHFLAYVSALPTGVTAVSLAIMLALFLAITVFMIIVWILIIVFAFYVLSFVLKSFSGE